MEMTGKPWPWTVQAQEIVQRAIRDGAPKVDLLPDEFGEELAQCKTRQRLVASENLEDYWVQEVFYRGAWRILSQTDLFDDVGTVLCARNKEETRTLDEILPKAYGARIRIEAVSLITHMTDG